MNILGIDTSTKKANVCLKKDNMLFDNSIDNEITHSEKLLPLVDKTLKEATINLNSIDYLACCIGPGSFTGIRIGLSTVKAFAKVISKPIFAVSSLDILAYTNNDNSDYVISIMDAKNSRIYYCLYKVTYTNDNIPILEKIADYQNDLVDVAIKNICETLSKEKITKSSKIQVVGDCVNNYNMIFKDSLTPFFENIQMYTENLSGKVLVNMLENYIKADCVLPYTKDYLTLDAVYVRPSQAERAKRNEL